MIIQKENKQARMGIWLLKLLSRHMKTKTKNKHQKQIIIKVTEK